MQSIGDIINQIGDPRLLFIPDDRVTRQEAAKMCGIGETYFDEKIRKAYDLGENRAFGRKITFSRHKLLKVIWEHSERFESQYKTE